MKARLLRPSSAVIFLAVATSFSGSLVWAAPTRVVRRGAGVRPSSATSPAVVSYTVEVPIVTRTVGTAFFRTAIDISNNTGSGTAAVPVVVRLQYSYNRVNSDHSLSFFRTPNPTLPAGQALNMNLLAFDNFHTDDIVQYLGSLNVLEAGAAENSFGTLDVTFENLPSIQGWEGTVLARTYSPNPTGAGTVAIAYPASLFFESASQTLVATIRDTQTSPSDAGALRTNIGIRNTDVNNTARDVTVQVTFYDVTTGSPTNGQRVGALLSLTLRPGEVQQLNNVRALAAIPNNVTAMLAFADVLGQAGPTIEGYVNILDGGTQDGAFFEMKCADTDGCDN
jgi:hypothetical protein